MRTLGIIISIGLWLAPSLSSIAQDGLLSTTAIAEYARQAGHADLVSAAEQGSFSAAWDLGVFYAFDAPRPDGVAAYVWFGISSAFNRGCVNPGADFRDMIAVELTPHQIAQADSLTEAWLAEHQQALAQTPDDGCPPPAPG